MKKTWKMRKNREAVSPVIATILMVAITVVLAAVLYVMVMGFTPGGGSAATGALDSNKIADNTYRVTLLSISRPDVLNSSVTLIVTPAAGSGVWHLVAGGTVLGAGDYVDLTTVQGTPYTVMLRDDATNNAIATLTFTAT